MSAGAFENGRYESIDGLYVWPVRAQPESKALTLNDVANAYPEDPVTTGLPKAKLRKGKREFGPTIRTVTVKMTAAPTGGQADYLGIGALLTVPVFQQSTWEAYGEGQTGTYLGTAVEFVGKFPTS
jgi:hypothetical protein